MSASRGRVIRNAYLIVVLLYIPRSLVGLKLSLSKLVLGGALIALGLFIGTLSGFRGVCGSPFGYCISDPAVSDYIGLWIGLGGAIAVTGGALVGMAFKGKA